MSEAGSPMKTGVTPVSSTSQDLGKITCDGDGKTWGTPETAMESSGAFPGHSSAITMSGREAKYQGFTVATGRAPTLLLQLPIHERRASLPHSDGLNTPDFHPGRHDFLD